MADHAEAAALPAFDPEDIVLEVPVLADGAKEAYQAETTSSNGVESAMHSEGRAGDDVTKGSEASLSPPQPTSTRMKLSPAAVEFVPQSSMQSKEELSQIQTKKQANLAPLMPGFPPRFSPPTIPQDLPLAMQQQLAQQFILQREAMMLFQQQQQQGLRPQMRPPPFAMMQNQPQFQQFPAGFQPFQGGQFPPMMQQAPFGSPSQQFQQPPTEQMQHFGEPHQTPPQQQAAGAPEMSEEVREKVVKQVEFYLSDQNLPTDNYLMKIVRRDPEGWVPIKTIAGFSKIKSLSKNQAAIAQALQSSQQLVVSPDGRKVRRSQPLPNVDLFEIQMRTVVAENLPPNPTIQGMEALFSKVGKVNMVRICHPEGANSATQSARDAQANTKNAPSLLVSTRQHALIEMESVELADRACVELTDKQNWRSGLQVRPLVRRQGVRKGAPGRNSQGEADGDGSGAENEGTKERKVQANLEGPAYGRGRGRVQQNQPTSNTQNRDPSPAKAALPKGPRMPDGTKGFTLGRGRSMNALGRSAIPLGAPADESESKSVGKHSDAERRN